MKNYISNTKILAYLIALLINILLPLQVFAINDFYSANDILFYDPSSSGCLSTSNIYTSPNSTINQEITAKFLTSTNFLGNSNKPMNAVQMAAIMGNVEQESGFSPTAGTGGGSHQGIIQWDDGRWKDIAELKIDLKNQLDFLKKELDGDYYKGKVGSEFWSASTTADLNKATYAIARNYEVAVQNGGGSTLWTNDADAKNNIQDWWNQPLNQPENGRRVYAHDLYDKFGNLAGSGYIPGSDCGGLVSGGMTLEAAQSFMTVYKNLEPKDWTTGTTATIYNINGTNCSGGSLANCVAFSQYFINRYTSKKYVDTSDGKNVVRDLLGLGFTDGGHTPKVYSIFSRSTGEHGHTGVVLGIDTTNNTIIIGEAACGNPLDWADARQESLSEFSSNIYTYAYTDGILKGGAL